MLGRKPQKDASTRPSTSAAASIGKKGVSSAKTSNKKRKWEESDDEASDEQKITKDDIEKWKATMKEEEKEELKERERREREEQEKKRLRQAAADDERRRREAEEVEAFKVVEEARKAAEDAEAARRTEDFVATPVHQLQPELPLITPSGVHKGKEHLYKTSFCKRWEQGNCNFGSTCHFAHGERELRGKPPKGSPPGTMSIAFPPDMPRPMSTRSLTASGEVPVGGTIMAPQGWTMPGADHATFDAAAAAAFMAAGGLPELVAPALRFGNITIGGVPGAESVPRVVLPPARPPGGDFAEFFSELGSSVFASGDGPTMGVGGGSVGDTAVDLSSVDMSAVAAAPADMAAAVGQLRPETAVAALRLLGMLGNSPGHAQQQ